MATASSVSPNLASYLHDVYDEHSHLRPSISRLRTSIMTTISSYVPNLDLRELSAFRAFQVEQEREGRKLRL